MYESSGSQVFRTITRIQSGPNAFDESMFVMAFLTILGVTEISYTFRLVLEGKTDKEIDTRVIKIRVFRKVFSKQFCFVRCRRHPRAVEQKMYSRFTFVENTISNSQKVPRAKFLEVIDSFVLLAHFIYPFETISSLSELYFRFRRFILLTKTKKSDF